MPAPEHVAGHCAREAFAGTKEPGKWQLFVAYDFILQLRLAASFVQNTQRVCISEHSFQVPAMLETFQILSQAQQWLRLTSLAVLFCHVQSVTFV